MHQPSQLQMLPSLAIRSRTHSGDQDTHPAHTEVPGFPWLTLPHRIFTSYLWLCDAFGQLTAGFSSKTKPFPVRVNLPVSECGHCGLLNSLAAILFLNPFILRLHIAQSHVVLSKERPLTIRVIYRHFPLRLDISRTFKGILPSNLSPLPGSEVPTVPPGPPAS